MITKAKALSLVLLAGLAVSAGTAQAQPWRPHHWRHGHAGSHAHSHGPHGFSDASSQAWNNGPMSGASSSAMNVGPGGASGAFASAFGGPGHSSAMSSSFSAGPGGASGAFSGSFNIGGQTHSFSASFNGGPGGFSSSSSSASSGRIGDQAMALGANLLLHRLRHR